MTAQDAGFPEVKYASFPANSVLPGEAEEDFSQNIDTLVIIQISRQVLEDYLSTSMPA
ncbi:hypothetical protein DPMN_043208 [Dreissena polymorpha]|uniref:Uncharacterized protein n=1 Tax=Dreissena polymorpha TaxID=45954 RepID=A0A9D4D007_DREPO|nr:hypothetical protein DPMN_043208 [Dreissena polymorpha]